MKTFTVQSHLLKARASASQGNLEGAFVFYQEILQKFPDNKKAKAGINEIEDALFLKNSPNSSDLREVSGLYKSGNFTELSKRLVELLSDYPNSIFLWNIAGGMHWALGNWEKAEKTFRRTIELNRNFTTGYNNLSALLTQQGRHAEAAENSRQALRIRPDQAGAHNNLGNALKNLKRLDEAIECFEKAISLEPNHAASHNNLGDSFRVKKQWKDAIRCFVRATELAPDSAEPYYNLGVTFLELEDWGKAIENFSQAIKIKPDYIEAHNELGDAFSFSGQRDRAIECQLRAIAIKPDHAVSHYCLGKLFHEQGNFAASLKSYRQAIKIDPDLPVAQARLLFQKRNICDWTPEPGFDGIWETLGLGNQSINPYIPLFMDDDPNRQMRRCVNSVKKRGFLNPPPLPKRPEARPPKLRIGYFSSDFGDHPVFHLISGLLREHDRDRFEIHAYSYGGAPVEKHRQNLDGLVDGFTDIRPLSKEGAADLARKHDLHIAIDLNGYTQSSRSELFAYRPAPIQINYLGYPGTMGADFMDYIIADPVLIPEEYRDGYTESVIYLPDTFMPNDDSRSIAETETSRAEFGLPEGGFVFCCFNNLCKISPAEFDIWMRLLRRMEGSVLWLSAASETVKANLRKEAVARGVDAERIVFADRLPSVAEHLARLKHADLFLDTFNYNAHATTCDALWGGLPVVTKIGRQFAARVAASLLTAIGLPELITASEEEYERLILELATDPQRLSGIRAKLAGNRASRPLFDTAGYTRHFEQALDEAFDRYLKGLPPEDLRIGTAA